MLSQSLLFSALVTVAAAAALPARAETAFIRQADATPHGDIDLSPMLGTYALVGVQYGAKAGIRILPKGFITALNDSVSVDVGVFKGHWLMLDETYASASMRWDFHVSHRWTVFAAPGLCSQRTVGTDLWDDTVTTSTRTAPAIQTGAFLHFNDAWAMRMEWDSGDAALRVGGTLKI